MTTSAITAARTASASLFGRTGELTPLDGELDRNFLLTGANGQRAIVKLMRTGCEPGFVAMQCAALEHLHGGALSFAVPRVVPALDGALFANIDVDGQSRMVWMLGYCGGTLWAEHWPRDGALRRALGEALAQLDVALAGFDDPLLRRGHRWS